MEDIKKEGKKREKRKEEGRRYIEQDVREIRERKEGTL